MKTKVEEQLKAKYMHTDDLKTENRNDGNTLLAVRFGKLKAK